MFRLAKRAYAYMMSGPMIKLGKNDIAFHGAKSNPFIPVFRFVLTLSLAMVIYLSYIWMTARR